MIKWEDRSNAMERCWWLLTIRDVCDVSVSRPTVAEAWRVAIGWSAGRRDRFALPAHWDDEQAKAEALRFLAPQLAALAVNLGSALQQVADAIDAAAAAR